MRILAAAAAAATVLGLALLVAADGVGPTVSWGTLGPGVVALVFAGLAAPLVGRPQARPIGLLLLAGGVGMAASIAGGGYAAFGRARGWPGAEAAEVATGWLWVFAVVPTTTVLLAIFPDGRAPSSSWRAAIWAGWCATGLIAVGSAIGSQAVAFTVGGPVWTAAGVAGIASLVVRWRRSGGAARQQVKYLMLAALLVMVLYAVADLLPYHAQQAAYLAVPLVLVGAVALAVWRFRLYDIDVVIRRTAVFVGVSTLVFLAYLGVAAAFGANPSERAALVAAVIVAVVAEPVRRAVQRATTRLLFGRRDEPLAATAVLRERLDDVTDATALAAAVSEVVPALLRAPWAVVRLLDEGPADEARFEPTEPEAFAAPLVHQSELLGALVVAQREPGVPFGRADVALIAELGHQVAAAAHAVRLREELRAAADRTSRAAAQERERLRRDLHDRLGPLLVGTGLSVDGLRRTVARDGAAERGLAEIAEQLRGASGEVRRIVDRLEPAALLDLGLAEAVADHLDRLAGLPDVPVGRLVVDGDGPLPSSVQEAAYFLVLEAVTNVLRHARARRFTVRLRRSDTALDVEVDDDGRGPGLPWVAGVGVGSMRRRALELGGRFLLGPSALGGTRVHATFPLEVPWAPPPGPSGSSSPTTTPSSGSVCDACSTRSTDSRSSARPPTPSRPSPQPAS